MDEETDSIMMAVQAIFEMVQEEFGKAAEKADGRGAGAGAGAGASSSSSAATAAAAAVAAAGVRWTGLDPDAKQRVDVRARDEVNRLRAVFRGASAALEALPGLRLTRGEVEELLRAQEEEGRRLDALLAVLPKDPAEVTALSGEADKYAAEAKAIGWPGTAARAKKEAGAAGTAEGGGRGDGGGGGDAMAL
jgi:hypothetical protein